MEKMEKAEKAKRKKYSQEVLRNALAAVNSGKTIRSVSKIFGIPKTTLLYKHKGIIPIGKNMGPPPVLSQDEESKLVNWMIHIGDRGFPVRKIQLINSVELLIKQSKRVTPFKDGRPGRHWYEGFLRRHPEVTERFSRNISSAGVKKENRIRDWHAKIELYLKEKEFTNIATSRVFNCDEVAFYLTPKDVNILIKKGDKAVHNFVPHDDNECLTTLFMGSANGILAPPMVVLCDERIPVNVSHETMSIHESWGIGKSNNGWMTGECFFEYIVNVFDPWMTTNNIQRPVVLYLDGHSSYFTMALDEFCSEKGIELIALFPNATNMVQPLDVAFFQPLKVAWSKATHDWRLANVGKRLGKENFASVLVQALSTLNVGEMIADGFRLSGLHPFSPDAVDHTPIVKQEVILSPINHPSRELTKKEKEIQKHLKFFEEQIDEDRLMAFRDAESIANWYGDLRDEGLFFFWFRLRRLVNNEL